MSSKKSSVPRHSMNSEIQSFEEANDLLALPLDTLLQKANRLRQEHFGNRIDLCAIINARSGNCSMNCAFCSQSMVSKAKICEYTLLDPARLSSRILELSRLPVNHIGIVTSGGMLGEDDVDSLCKTIDSLPRDILPRLCVSLGRLKDASLVRLRECGITRYHHNLECAESFYPQICQTQKWSEREKTILHARALGFVNCTGGLFGLGESWQHRIEFAFSLRRLRISHIPMNFLHPHADTPLGGRSPLQAQEALRIIALFRILLPHASLRICGGRPITFPDAPERIFLAGANALMIGDYLTTKGSGAENDLSMLQKCNLVADFPSSSIKTQNKEEK